MTLISILAGLALEYFLGALDHIRNRDWFDNYRRILEKRCSFWPNFDGPWGVLLTLALPLCLLLLVSHLLSSVSMLLVFMLAIAVFVYSLGPDFNTLFNGYTEALEKSASSIRCTIAASPFSSASV